MSSVPGEAPASAVAASPLDNFLHYVPKSHEASLRQAIYNGMVFVFLAVVVMATYYGLAVMKPFLYPMFWAVLAGFIIHPYKAYLTQSIQTILKDSEDEDTPLVVRHIVRGGRRLLGLCETVGSSIFYKLPWLLVLGVALPLLTYLTNLPLSVWGNSLSTCHYVSSLVLSVATVLSFKILLILAVLYLVSTHFFEIRVWPAVALAFWLLVASHVFHALGWVLSSLLCFGLTARFLIPTKGVEEEATSEAPTLGQIGRFRSAVRNFVQTRRDDTPVREVSEVPPTPLPNPEGSSVRVLEHQKVEALRGVDTPTSTRKSSLPGRTPSRARASGSKAPPAEAESSVYIKSVFWGCVYIQFYLRPALLLLLPIPLFIHIVKELIVFFELMPQLEELVHLGLTHLKTWFQARQDVLLPNPVRVVYRVLIQLERTLVRTLPNYLDHIISAGMIFFLLLTSAAVIVMFSFELYSEGVHIFHMSSQFLSTLSNSSFVQHINGTILSSSSLNMEDLFESGYVSGRKYISSSIRDMIRTENDKDSEELERQVLELWDRMYQYWTWPSANVEYGPHVSNDAIKSSFTELYNGIVQQKWMSLASITQFSKDNMGTISTVIEQTWHLIQSNLGLTLTGVGAILRLVFSSGSNLINIVLNFIVFLSALYYLLVNSGQVYIPLELLSNVGHTLGKGFGDSLNSTVNGVFKVAMKMACFYGLWTYLTHTVFHASIVAIPVLVATFLAAVPVAGQYLVSVPAALELVLNERYLSAAGLMLCHLLPMWVVDAAIYAEIRRVIHPWLTGLSILGGVYYFGFDGAIYGPLILCAVIVTISMYTNILQELPRGSERRSSLILQRSDSLF